MRHAALILAAAVALTGAAPAAAQSTADVADVRCLMVLQFIARDPKQAEQAARGIFYYLGRISSRGATSRIEFVMKAEAPKLNAQVGQTELARCGGELTNQTKELQAVNQRLAAQFKPPAATAPKK